MQARCTKCGETKEKTGFYRDKRKRSGLTSWCKICTLADVKKRYVRRPPKPRKPPRPLKERFNAKWIPEPNSGCWLWIGARRSKNYGAIGHSNGKTISAHRAAWLVYVGEIPDGICVLHRCDTPECVNPGHLWLGTHSENMQDMISKGRGNRHPKRVCKHGHEFTPENTIIFKRGINAGFQYCRQCKNRSQREWYQRKKANAA